jgi:hypothetical protein
MKVGSGVGENALIFVSLKYVCACTFNGKLIHTRENSEYFQAKIKL